MQMLCDVNVLIALVYRKHAHSSRAAQWLSDVDDDGAVVVCRQVQLGMLRILSTRTIMGKDVLTSPACWAVFDAMMSDQRFVFAREPQGIEMAFRHAMRDPMISPKLWQDAYLAAFAIAGRMQLVTFDASFRQYKKLEHCILT